MSVLLCCPEFSPQMAGMICPDGVWTTRVSSQGVSPKVPREVEKISKSNRRKAMSGNIEGIRVEWLELSFGQTHCRPVLAPCTLRSPPLRRRRGSRGFAGKCCSDEKRKTRQCKQQQRDIFHRPAGPSLPRRPRRQTRSTRRTLPRRTHLPRRRRRRRGRRAKSIQKRCSRCRCGSRR